ncbi:hypothetical protein [Clostridium sp. DL1XJH146]
MKEYLRKNIVNLAILIFQFITVIVIIVLEYLSGYKGGLMHHLYYRKIEYLSKIYTANGMIVHLIIIVLLLLLILYIAKNKWENINKVNIIKYILCSILLTIAFYLPYLENLNTYAYILMFLEISIAIETVQMVINGYKQI